MPRRESSSSARKATKAALLPQIVALRREGRSLRDIGDLLGISRDTVSTYYKEAVADLADSTEEQVELVREMRSAAVERTLQVIKVWHPRAIAVTLDEKGNEVGPDANAAAIVLKYEERLAKILGFDAPTKSSTDLTTGGNALNVPAPVDLSKLSASDLALLETLYAKAGVLQLPGADRPADAS